MKPSEYDAVPPSLDYLGRYSDEAVDLARRILRDAIALVAGRTDSDAEWLLRIVLRGVEAERVKRLECGTYTVPRIER